MGLHFQELAVAKSKEEPVEVWSAAILWFEVDIEDIVFEGVDGLEGDRKLLLVLLSVDEVDGPGVGNEESSEY